MPLPNTTQYTAMAEAVARHMIKLGRKPDCTAEDILDVAPDYGKLVTWYFNALAELNENNFYKSVDDLPNNPGYGARATVRIGKTNYQYVYYDGWVTYGSSDDDIYK